MNNKVNKFITWMAINILLPILPVAIKWGISLFADGNKISVTILDSVELLYYNLFIDVIFLNIAKNKENLTIIETILQFVFYAIIILDLVLITINYVNLASKRCATIAIILSIVVPIVVSVYQWKNMQEVD